ncbi:MAG TPA: DNA-3-methyladenine glycosylase I [Haloplasmataceae bacterium]
MRCEWCLNDELYIKYHDYEWGKPNYDDKVLYEFLVLESMQAGLSWLTILKKREAFRKAFADFDYYQVAKFHEKRIEELLMDSNIIRNRRKIEAAINNAQRFIEVQKEFGSFAQYLWGFVNNRPIINHYNNIYEIPTKTVLSDKIALDFKKRGFKFLGTTIIYSYLQAIGIINDHIDKCSFKYQNQGDLGGEC